ncbi:hypothetical protein L0F63_001507 [Massospora cicadina]|nr:hypothetical protein L0F63_001507 [Massospora cicadina]
MNPYDVRKKCGNNDLCYDIIGDMEEYLNQASVKKELGARSSNFESCNIKVNLGFARAGDWMKPYVRDVPVLLEGGIRVLIYAGDADFICNWMGNKAWTKKLPWSGQNQFVKAKDHIWINPENGEGAGEFRHYKNFAFLRVFKAGHMVPYDQPSAAAEMFNRWLQNHPFTD